MSYSSMLKDILAEELSNVAVFTRILKFGPARQKILQCFSVCLTNVFLYKVLIM